MEHDEQNGEPVIRCWLDRLLTQKLVFSVTGGVGKSRRSKGLASGDKVIRSVMTLSGICVTITESGREKCKALKRATRNSTFG